MSLPNKHISSNKIVNQIKKLKPNIYPGHDLITSKILRILPRKQ